MKHQEGDSFSRARLQGAISSQGARATCAHEARWPRQMAGSAAKARALCIPPPNEVYTRRNLLRRVAWRKSSSFAPYRALLRRGGVHFQAVRARKARAFERAEKMARKKMNPPKCLTQSHLVFASSRRSLVQHDAVPQPRERERERAAHSLSHQTDATRQSLFSSRMVNQAREW